ncbi:MAG: lipase maturation factor family protein [Terracidiphilus sp.]
MLSGDTYLGNVWVARVLLQRGMAAIYVIAFIAVLRQFKPLLGERGLLPVPDFLEGHSFREVPSIFCWRYSDRLLDVVAWTGLLVAICALCGVTEAGSVWISVGAGLLLWFLYLSIVNVGQQFFGFGWESMLLEAGFFTAFLGPSRMAPSILPVLMLRWMLFRTEMGAGLIKLRHDPCWRELTCLYYHYETQPLPNPLSWYFHRLPTMFHRFAVVFSHFVQLVVPFGLFAPQPIASIAGGLIILHQLWLIISGNYAWLNWLTAILGLSAFSNQILGFVLRWNVPPLEPLPLAFRIVLYGLSVATVLLSIEPVLNLLSKNQVMNFSYNRFHLVNTYGAFGRVGRDRYEIVIEGTTERSITQDTLWQAYGFKAKPGDPVRRPPQVAPYHIRLDWLIWFLPFAVTVTVSGIRVGRYDVWFLRLIQELLLGDPAILRLMGTNPFAERPPVYLRALFYRYRFTGWQEKRETGAWWRRTLLGVYLEPVSIETFERV